MSRDMCKHAIDRRRYFCRDCASADELRDALDLVEQDSERLRGLIKEAEEASGDMSCLWCRIGNQSTKTPHPHGCPAFTPEGEVH